MSDKSGKSEKIVRFSRLQRLEHLAVMLLFIALSITGFPQKFPDTSWARAVIRVIGSVEAARWVHRVSGILFAVLSVVHLARAGWMVATGSARPTMVPTRRDFADAVQTLRYYFGLTDRHARFDRYDYRQKFEYWGLVLGGLLMVVTGFILYFPITFTNWFPGDLIPAAKVAHSNEGLMAFLVVITWHIYNAHLAPEVFPFDTSIFTGTVTRERMEHEHPLELARMGDEPATGPRPTPEDETRELARTEGSDGPSRAGRDA